MPHAEKSPEPEVHQRRNGGPAAEREPSSPSTVQAVSELVPRELAQRQRLQAAFGPAAQLQAEDDDLLQGRFAEGLAQRAAIEEEEPLQGKFSATLQRAAMEDEEPAQARSAEPANQTGMPDGLKAGIESLSGMDMSAVRVHRNSSQPAQLNALAYAQGNDIHLGPGQEQHLPHEAWHVVQQRQGRVQPTMQLAGTAVNDDVSLESEADVMGARALQRKAAANDTKVVVQRVGDYLYGSANTTPHVHVYGSNSHLQIMHRRRVRRLNIVQNGQVHAQAQEALEAAAGNQTLVDVIQGLIDAA